MVMFRTEQLTT